MFAPHRVTYMVIFSINTFEDSWFWVDTGVGNAVLIK